MVFKIVDKKHLIWTTAFILIAIIVCGTVIYLNHNSWTVRFEMDDNTRAAVESLDLEKLNKNSLEEEVNKYWAEKCIPMYFNNETGVFIKRNDTTSRDCINYFEWRGLK